MSAPLSAPLFLGMMVFHQGRGGERLLCLIINRLSCISHSAETDLEDIKEAFIDKYEKKLSKMVKVGDGNLF